MCAAGSGNPISAGLPGAMASSLGRLYDSLGINAEHMASIDVDRELISGRLAKSPTTSTTHNGHGTEG